VKTLLKSGGRSRRASSQRRVTTIASNSVSATPSFNNGVKYGLIAAGTAAIVGGVYYYSAETLYASGKLDPPAYPWSHRFPWQAFDHASIRRGHKVFSQVCSTCHSLNLVRFRNLVDVCYTEAEAKEIAAELEYTDGPDETGEMFTRPGKLTDAFPKPYANKKQAASINGGAVPPDLSLITKARHDGTNYLFSLLTGYKDAPAGIQLREGQYYNPYFAGGAIAMPPPLTDGQVEYEDKTPSTVSQMAKDVTTFLAWASEPETEERRVFCGKVVLMTAAMLFPLGYYKRYVWNVFKTRIVRFNMGKFAPPPPPQNIRWRKRERSNK